MCIMSVFLFVVTFCFIVFFANTAQQMSLKFVDVTLYSICLRPVILVMQSHFCVILHRFASFELQQGLILTIQQTHG